MSISRQQSSQSIGKLSKSSSKHRIFPNTSSETDQEEMDVENDSNAPVQRVKTSRRQNHQQMDVLLETSHEALKFPNEPSGNKPSLNSGHAATTPKTSSSRPPNSLSPSSSFSSRSEANFYQQLSFSYMNEIIKAGSKRNLLPEEYPEVEIDDDANRLGELIAHEWNNEKSINPSNPKLWRVLYRIYGTQLLGTSMIYFLESIIKISQSYFLGLLLSWLELQLFNNYDGYYYAAGLSVAVCGQALLNQYKFFLGTRMGMQIRIGVAAAIYKKCLSLPASRLTSPGQIINMISNDVQKFEDASGFIYYIVVGPIEALLILFFIYQQIGLASLAAIGILLLLIPLQSVFARNFAALRRLSNNHRDNRIKSMSDMIIGVIVVKLYAWEIPFIEKIKELREKEMKTILSASILRAMNEAIFFASSSIVSVVTFVTFFFLGGKFSSSAVFSCLTYLQTTRMTMTNLFSKGLQFTSEAMVSLQRVENFFLIPNMDQGAPKDLTHLKELNHPNVMIAIKNGSFSWKPLPASVPGPLKKSDSALKSSFDNIKQSSLDSRQTLNDSTPKITSSSSDILINKKPDEYIKPKPSSPKISVDLNIVLKDINLSVRKGELVGICGPVGSGKTSLIHAVMNELECVSGAFALRSKRIGYASQNQWIQSGTIKDTILFGRDMKTEWFWEVVKACALDTDLEALPMRENTVIGERGFTLSGGQRARLALARAVYGDADIYLLDDPLSAVDTHVGKILFEQCIRGLLRKKAVLLVTHLLQFVERCDRVYLIEDGRVTDSGTFDSIASLSLSSFALMMREYSTMESNLDEFLGELDEKLKEVSEESLKNLGLKNVSRHSEVSINDDAVTDKELRELRISLSKRFSLAKTQLSRDNSMPVIRINNRRKSQFLNEDTVQGTISSRTYYRFVKSGSSVAGLCGLLVALIIGQGCSLFTDWWLSSWAAQSITDQKNFTNAFVFIILGCGTLILAMLRSIWFFTVCLKASRNIFDAMIDNVFRSPLQFFQKNPHGRIMNRLSKDVNVVDEMLPQTFFDFVQRSFMILSTLVIVAMVIPHALISLPLLSVLFLMLRKSYMKASRQMKRLEATTRSPVYSTLTSMLEGATLIRSFRSQERFTREFMELQNDNTRIYFSFICSGRWLGLRLDFMAASFFALIAFLSILVYQPLGLTASKVGLLLSYILQLVGLLQWSVRQSAEVENLMVSTERLLEYSDLTPEGQKTADSKVELPDAWPSAGHIQIKNMSLQYPGSSRFVLNGITIDIPAGTRIGIVGRTGAGKSSFIQALFRLFEATPEDAICVDGVFISKLKLKDLRSRLAIIPQEPFCFKGTLRFNLDPSRLYSDSEIWRALEMVELKRIVTQLPDQLDCEVSENGSNWSVGERQLICLARAILRNSKIVVMDEATASVDIRTDGLIQKIVSSDTYNSAFDRPTVITIAHRLHTIADYDEIIVLDDGEIVERGAPGTLLEKDPGSASSYFAKMALELGPDAAQVLKKLARANQRLSVVARQSVARKDRIAFT